MNNRVLSVDPGEKRIGIAISDPSGTIAGPLDVIQNKSRKASASKIASLAEKFQVRLIVLGLAINEDGSHGPQARRAERLAEEIKNFTKTPVALWDESQSTQIAREAQFSMMGRGKNRKTRVDAIAATVILQSYLEFLRYDEDESHEIKKL